MKLKKGFVIVLLTILLNLARGKEKNSVIPYAINEIIEKHFVNLETFPGQVDMLFIGNMNMEFFNLIDKLLKIKSANTKVTVSKNKFKERFDYGQEFLQLGDSSIVFFDSVKIFLKCASFIRWIYYKRY